MRCDGAMKPLFIGIKGRVLRIDRRTGQALWETHLAGSQFVNVQTSGDDLLASTKGELYCLDPDTGRIKWQNGLPGMGWGIMTITGESDHSSAMAQELLQRQQSANRGAGTAGAG